MPRLLAQLNYLPNTPMLDAVYEALELAGLMYLVESGALDQITDNKMAQIACASAAYTYYDRYIVNNV